MLLGSGPGLPGFAGLLEAAGGRSRTAAVAGAASGSVPAW